MRRRRCMIISKTLNKLKFVFLYGIVSALIKHEQSVSYESTVKGNALYEHRVPVIMH